MRKLGDVGKSRPKEYFTPRNQAGQFISRDSDASLCSNRLSSSSMGGGGGGGGGNHPSQGVMDRSFQKSALSALNLYLEAHKLPTLKPPYPSAKDIMATIRFLLSRLDYPSDRPEEDLPILLKQLNYPCKLNKSALRAPGTPHSWPSLLHVLHWLHQMCTFSDHLHASSTPFLKDNNLFSYSVDSYLHFIHGEDDAVTILDHDFAAQLNQGKETIVEEVNALQEKSLALQSKLDCLRSTPSLRDVVDNERAMLEADSVKFHTVIDQFSESIAEQDKALKERERELAAKEEETGRIAAENEELRKRLAVQPIKSRDAERMKRELQSVEREMEEVETSRNAWESKSWDLDATLGHKFKELEALAMEFKQAIKRLKLGDSYEFVLDPKGSTPAEVLGVDYKAKLKPALQSLANDLKKNSMERLEEVISLQQRSVENATKIDVKKNRISELQSYIDEVDAQKNLLKKEMDDYAFSCQMEARKILENIELEARNSDTVEKEAIEGLKAAELHLQATSRKNEEEIQKYKNELFALVDSVSKYKEYMSTKISEMEDSFSEVATSISRAYKASLNTDFTATG